MNGYDLRFFDQFGNLLFTFDIFIELEFGRQKNNIGACSLLIPGNIYDISKFQPDSFLEIWRYDSFTNSMKLFGDTIYFLKKFEYSQNKNSEVIELVFYDTIDILSRRYNLWLLSEFTDYPSHMNRPIVDQMVQIFNHNFGNNTETKSLQMTITGPSGNDPSIAAQLVGVNDRKFEFIEPMQLVSGTYNETPFNVENAWKNCLDIFNDLSKLSDSRNIPIWFDIIYTPSDSLAGNFKFKIWEGIRGNNYTNEYNRKIFTPDSGNFEGVKLTIDYTNYANAIIAISDEILDTNSSFDEVIQAVAKTYDYNYLPFHPIEFLVEERKTSDPNSLVAFAQSKLAEKRAVQKLTGDIINLPGFQFGIDFNYGDLVIVQVKNLSFIAEINKFNISVNKSGEKISIPIDSSTLLLQI